MVDYTTIEVKSGLNKLKFIDSWYWTRYTINSYRGCQIGCIYCHSRNDRYQQPVEFENNIEIKMNLPRVLLKEVRRIKSHQIDVVGISGATDPYQAAERTYKITKQVLEILKNYRLPVHIITKSRMIRRDLELLNSIAEQNWATISITMTTLDQQLAQVLEQGAPSPLQRLELIEYIKDEFPAIQVGVSATPIIPFLSDSDEQIQELVRIVREYQADYLLGSVGLSMNNQQAQWFLKKIKEYDQSNQTEIYNYLKELYQFTDKIFNEGGGYDGKNGPKSDRVKLKNQLLQKTAQKEKLPTLITRWIPGDFRKYNYILAEELFSEIGKSAGRDPLYFAAMNLQNLKSSIVDNPELVSKLTPSTVVQQEIMNRLKKKNWKRTQYRLDEYF